jgi:sugar phosphate permease
MSSAVSAEHAPVKVYGYRWVILAVWMFVNVLMQALWICNAPVSSQAAQVWGVSEFWVGFLAMSFMYVYIVMSLPASWVIEKYGFSVAVAISAIVMGAAALAKGVFASSYAVALTCQIAMAIVQPLMVNSGTKFAAKWFPIQERATVVGIGSLGPFIGQAFGLMATPFMVQAYGFSTTFLLYGVVAAISAVLFVIFSRETPPTPAGYEERIEMTAGLKLVLTKLDFYLLALAFFVVFAIWQGVPTWIEGISKLRGLSATEAGTAGGILMLAGVVGALLIPAVSDRLRKRKPVLIAALLLSLPGVLGLTFVNGFALVLLSCIWLGIFLVGAIPLVLQYAVEACYPAPEPASSGILMIASQASVVAITIMGWAYEKTGSFASSLLAITALLLISALALFKMKESRVIQGAPAPEAVPAHAD